MRNSSKRIIVFLCGNKANYWLVPCLIYSFFVPVSQNNVFCEKKTQSGILLRIGQNEPAFDSTAGRSCWGEWRKIIKLVALQHKDALLISFAPPSGVQGCGRKQMVSCGAVARCGRAETFIEYQPSPGRSIIGLSLVSSEHTADEGKGVPSPQLARR